MSRPIRTLSFDLWDTVFIDDSDEPKRAAQAMATKAVERRDLVERFLARHAPVCREAIEVAYATADAAFRRVWYGQNVTWTVQERLSVVLEGLARQLPASDFAELVRLHEEMELDVMPDLVPGVAQALRQLKGRYKLAVISDAIFSPGRVLRQILRAHGLGDVFDAFAFSDEAGCSKPDARLFRAVAEQTGCQSHELLHLGDRQEKDIDGAHAVGARAVLIPIVKDRGGPATTADAICRDYAELPRLVECLERGETPTTGP